MSISSIPDHILLNIFSHLPISDQYRVGHVSKHFRRISLEAISKTKRINLLDESMKDFSNSDLERLLDLCSKNLRQIVLESDPTYQMVGCQLDGRFVDVLARPTFPHLTSLRICSTSAADENLREILQNCPNLEYLRWKDIDMFGISSPSIFPDVHCENLRSLRIGDCTEASFRSLIGRCPNLKEFVTYARDPIPVEIWNQFFGTHPQLESLNINGLDNIDWTEIQNLWRLSSMTRLALKFDPLPNGDGFLAAIGGSFKKLRHLDIWFLFNASEGIKSLCSLTELRTIQMTCFRNENIEEGIHRMALNCKHLESFNIPSYTPTPITFVYLIRFCPDLKVLKISSVHDVDTPEAAADLLMSLRGKILPRRIKIDMAIYYVVIDEEDAILDSNLAEEYRQGKRKLEAWNSEQVKDALKVLEEEGVIIELNVHAKAGVSPISDFDDI